MTQAKSLPALQLQKLTKSYGKYRGIQDLQLTVRQGCVFGFLGPNGAGKTTAIRTIMNFLHPTSGTAMVLGMDSVKDSTKIKQRIGYLAGDLDLYDNLNGFQHLEFFSHLHGISKPEKRINELAEILDADLSRKVGTLSRGNMQKVALIAALIHDPDLLILDEPTTGLDPLIQNQFYDLVRDRVKLGKTVFMSSHILPEVQTICNEVAFMREGNIVETVDVDHLRNSQTKMVTIKFSVKNEVAIPRFKNLEVVHQGSGVKKFSTDEATRELLKWLSLQQLQDVTIEKISLENLFLKLYSGHEVGNVQ